MDYYPIKDPVYPSTGAGSSKAAKQEGRYWKEFKTSTFIKNYAAVTDLYFSPAAPHRFAVTSGTRVQIYTPKTARVVKTISRFKETARSGHIRDDGKLIVAGDDGGQVQIFDLASRAILRTIKDHQQPVHTTLFSSTSSAHNTPQILTSSDDGTVRTFDLSTAAPISTFSNHADYVRTASFLPSNPNMYLSGSYDGTVKLWDARSEPDSAESMSFNHGYPVEKVLIHPSGTMAISAGGPLIRIWDLLSGSSRPLKALSNHQKTITSLCWGDHTEYKKLLSGGLDGLVKVYNIEDGQWKVGHTMRYGGQILSMALSPSDSTLVVGSADGTLSIRSKPTGPVVLGGKTRNTKRLEALEEAQRNPKPKPLETTYRTSSKKRPPRLQEWDRLMRHFRYSDALDAVLERPEIDPKKVIALLDELKRQNALPQAMGGRDDQELLRILKFCSKHVSDPRWGSKISEYISVLIDLYERVLGQSSAIDQMFQLLQRKVREEMEFHNELNKILGGLEMLFSASDRPGIVSQV